MSTRPRPLAVFVLLALLIGCGKDKAADRDGSKPAEAPPEVATSVPKETDYKLTMDELEQEIKADSSVTSTKYGGKVLELSGIVESPIVDAGKKVVAFELKSSKPRPDHTTIEILCICDDRSVYGTLGRGQTLRVRGVYIRAGGIMKPCEVVEKGPDTRALIASPQLAAEFTANWDEAKRKYNEKTLVLSGTVSAIKHRSDGKGLEFNLLELKGDGNTVVECLYINPEVADRYKVGDAVELVGSLSFSVRGTLNIAFCWPLPK